MSDTADKLRSFYPDEISQEVYEAKLDVIEAAEQVVQPMTRAWQAVALSKALARLREVAG